ncbi:hypothetical protein N8963_02485 [Candidatus Pelagibacter sp.]|nr:hypothetical protein [Candidatus Pelagibacter sp.]
MFGIGIISLLQVWFLPGLSLLVFARKLKLIDKLLLCLPLSITLNYLLVFFLISLKSYNQVTLSILILIEFCLIIFFSRKDPHIIDSIKKFLSFIEFKKLRFKLNIIDLFIIFIFLIYIFLAASNIGNIFGAGDPLTIYNWTLDIINNQIPSDSYDYPQAAAILSSISFVLFNSLEIEFFSASIFLVQPLWIFFIGYRLVFLLKKFENEIKYSLVFVSIIVLYHFRHYLLFINLPDATVVLGAIFGAYILILSLKYIKIGLNIETILFCFVMAFPAILKQVGVYTSILFPVMYLILFYKKDENIIKNFILIFITIFLIFSPWYLFKFYDAFANGVEVSIYSVAVSHNNYDNKIFHIFIVLHRLFFGYGFIFILLLIYFSLRDKIAQKLFFVFLLPFFLVYAFSFGYEFRSFAPAMAPVGMLCGIGLAILIRNLKERFQKRKIKFFYRSILLLSVIFFITFMNEIRNFEKLKYLDLQASKKRGDHELNVLLYNFLNKDDEIKNIYVIRDLNDLNLLPEMSHKFINASCSTFKKIYEKNINKSYYILIDLREVSSNKLKDICKKSLFNRIESANEKKNIKKIFEYKNYMMYLREYKQF